ncbi:MAG TPA: stage III sporulation protein AF [Symbiobacteriaceae bacterium]|jgi:stage III sporulation protein AF|nr:stage III sporulation protein AF [Symbiobacteriaceae bacterium]
MDGVKEWVRHLVLLVLLATCLELLLPMNSMKKYVRLTMSLLVMLAVTQPILGLLGKPVAVDASLFAAPADKQLPTMAEIMAQASQFREKNQALANQEARGALAAEAVRAAKQVPGVADADASVVVVEANGEQQIQTVTVTIIPGTPGQIHRVEPVQPVQPVGGKAPAAPAQPAPQRELTPAEKSLVDAVRREVAGRLGLTADPRLIEVKVAPQSETQRR